MKIFPFLAALFLLSAGQAQSVVTDSTTRFLYYGIGYQYQSFSNLSNRIGVHPELEKPGTSFFNAYIGTSKQSDLFMSDYHFHVATARKGDDEKKNSNLVNFGAALNLGFNLLPKSSKIRLYPTIGISIESYFARFNKDLSAVPFDSIITSNSVRQAIEPVKFSNYFFCYQGGINIDFTQRNRRFLYSNGFRISYTGSFKKRSWRVNDNQAIANAPVDRIGQFNVAYLIGFGKRWGNRNSPDFR